MNDECGYKNAINAIRLISEEFFKSCPVQPGDRCELREPSNILKWSAKEYPFMVKGAKCTVESINWFKDSNGFEAQVVFDREFFYSKVDGNEIEAASKHSWSCKVSALKNLSNGKYSLTEEVSSKFLEVASGLEKNIQEIKKLLKK